MDETKQVLHPYCNICGWRKGGADSWDGQRCKCGHWEPPIKQVEAIVFPLMEQARAILQRTRGEG